MKDKNRVRSALEWTTEKTFELISLVESRGCLWDKQSAQYKHRAIRDQAWDEVAASLQFSKPEVICKWTLLRQQFRNAHNKFLQSAKSGRPLSRTPNEYYVKMLFMAPVFQHDTDASETHSTTGRSHCANKVKSLSLEDTSRSNFDNKLETSSSSTSCDDTHPAHPVKRKKLMKLSVKKETSGAIASEKQTLPHVDQKEEDEFDLWGRYLASTLRNYPDKTAIRKFKAAVSLSLAKLEGGELDSVQK